MAGPQQLRTARLWALHGPGGRHNEALLSSPHHLVPIETQPSSLDPQLRISLFQGLAPPCPQPLPEDPSNHTGRGYGPRTGWGDRGWNHHTDPERDGPTGGESPPSPEKGLRSGETASGQRGPGRSRPCTFLRRGLGPSGGGRAGWEPGTGLSGAGEGVGSGPKATRTWM